MLALASFSLLLIGRSLTARHAVQRATSLQSLTYGPRVAGCMLHAAGWTHTHITNVIARPAPKQNSNATQQRHPRQHTFNVNIRWLRLQYHPCIRTLIVVDIQLNLTRSRVVSLCTWHLWLLWKQNVTSRQSPTGWPVKLNRDRHHCFYVTYTHRSTFKIIHRIVNHTLNYTEHWGPTGANHQP